MIITIASYKGGVAKTTTAVHLAAYFHTIAPTLLIDSDIIRAATQWSQRGEGFPFRVADPVDGINSARDYKKGFIIIDTEANPAKVDFADVAHQCDLLVIPTVAETTVTDGLIFTLRSLQEIGSERYKILITRTRPRPNRDAQRLRDELEDVGITAVFESEIPNLIAFDKASAQGVPINGVKGDTNAARGWAAYERVGREILDDQKIRGA